MRYIKFYMLLLLLLFQSGMAQHNVKFVSSESYVIQTENMVNLYSWDITRDWIKLDALGYPRWDIPKKTLSFCTDLQIDGLDIIGIADLDGDQLWEIIAVQANYNIIEIVVLKPEPALFWIDSLATCKEIVRLTLTNSPTFKSMVFALQPTVILSIGNLDGDSLEEFVVAYLADDGKGKNYINITAFDVSASLKLTELGTIMDQEIPYPREVFLCRHRKRLFDIQCVDFNNDNRDEILLVGRSHKPGSLNLGYRLFASIYEYDPTINNLVNKLPSGMDLIYVQDSSCYYMDNLNLACMYNGTSDQTLGVVSFMEYNLPYNKNHYKENHSYNLIAIRWDEDNSEIWPISKTVQLQKIIKESIYYDRDSSWDEMFMLQVGGKLSLISGLISANSTKYEY